jgi:hypothetical protein
LPNQSGPTPKDLCEGAPDGEALDEDGAPRGDYAAGDVPNNQKPAVDGAPINEGQTVLTNGMNVGHRGGDPSAPGALASGAFTHDVFAGQGLRLQLVNAATTRFFRLLLTTEAGVKIPLIRVGGQGGVLNHARVEGDAITPVPGGTFEWKYTEGEILIDPGDRADVVAVIPGGTTGQVLTLWTQDFDRTGGAWANIPTVPVAHFNVTGTTGVSYVLLPGDPLRASLGPAALRLDRDPNRPRRQRLARGRGAVSAFERRLELPADAFELARSLAGRPGVFLLFAEEGRVAYVGSWRAGWLALTGCGLRSGAGRVFRACRAAGGGSRCSNTFAAGLGRSMSRFIGRAVWRRM